VSKTFVLVSFVGFCWRCFFPAAGFGRDFIVVYFEHLLVKIKMSCLVVVLHVFLSFGGLCLFPSKSTDSDVYSILYPIPQIQQHAKKTTPVNMGSVKIGYPNFGHYKFTKKSNPSVGQL
jgi:hypothetical protein